MYIFGGRMDKGHELFTGESFYSNDLHMFDTSKKVWLELKPDSSNHVMPLADSAEEKLKRFSPCGRRSHSAVAYRRKIIIFGGFQENAQKHFNDLYEFDVDKCAWKSCSFKGTVGLTELSLEISLNLFFELFYWIIIVYKNLIIHNWKYTFIYSKMIITQSNKLNRERLEKKFVTLTLLLAVVKRENN